MSIEIIQQQQTFLLLPEINRSMSPLLQTRWFEMQYWREQEAITGKSVGRNITWFVQHQQEHWVLRHYYRGGMIAKLLHDQFLFSSIANTRCFRELELLQQMTQQGLPVPKPIAARVIRGGLFYRADLLIEKIPNAQDLVAQLQESPLAEVNWHALGGLIGKFHQTGIFHADLNAHNILLDDNSQFWLIDFDRCEQRLAKRDWQQANLSRLKRSFLKEKRKFSIFHFAELQWQWLIQGYENFLHINGSK